MDFLAEMRRAALARVKERRDSVAERTTLDVSTRGTRRSLEEALNARPNIGACHVIAEVKRRSPSAGALRENLDPADLARAYVEAGAAAVSVLTEPERFGGSLEDLERVARRIDVPVLRKDFLLDPSQIQDSRNAGADAVLLIVRLLERGQLVDLLGCAAEAGLEALVEVHGIDELVIALEVRARIVGVNNRDLTTLATDVRHSFDLARAAREKGVGWPPVAVSESGIRSRAEILQLARAGYAAVLVGETLLRSDDPGRALGLLLGTDAVL